MRHCGLGVDGPVVVHGGTRVGKWRSAAVACVPILLSCGGGSLCPPAEFLDNPILRLQAANSATTGASISQIILSDIRIDGRLQSGGDLPFLVPRNARNVSVSGNQLRCTIACSFGVETGDYQFIVAATGYTDKTVIVADVRYSGAERDGCKVTPTGGPSISVLLDPAP